ncbi:hypothetical protein [Psychrobacter sp.]|uniref:hypothetical protein n=1 Tax=Psychrobacter sp. TaxID=56811 RepID=UPI003F9E98F2
MSSYSFSYQFHQRWTCAPESVRSAITQELKDITSLLQSEVPFESFVFSTHDLNAHVDELYDNHEAEQAIAKAIADKQAREQAAAEKKHQEEARITQEAQQQNKQVVTDKDNTEVTDAAEETETSNISEERTNSPQSNDAEGDTSTESQPTNSKATDSKVAPKADTITPSPSTTDAVTKQSNTVDNTLNKIDNTLKAVKDNASNAIKLSLKDEKLSTTHQTFIRELETQIDDYLSEQMMQMSEDLKSWLQAEVVQYLNESDASTPDKEPQKN